jgi:hypothetical protein
MSQRAEELATQFEKANDSLAEAVQQMSGPEWAATTPEEGWSVAAAAHHAAISAEPLTAFVQCAATGQPLPPITPERLNEMNAQHAKDFHNVSKEDVVSVIQKNVPPTAALLRSLNDEQLQKQAQTPFGMAMTTEQIIENVLIGHVQQHLASMQAAK